jgi:hypothetical protein
VQALDVRHKTIAFSSDRFDEARVPAGVAEGLTDSQDGSVNAGVEVDEYVLVPQLTGDFVTGHQFPRPVDQEQKEIHGLSSQVHTLTPTSELVGSRVDLEVSESENHPGGGANHCPVSVSQVA